MMYWKGRKMSLIISHHKDLQDQDVRQVNQQSIEQLDKHCSITHFPEIFKFEKLMEITYSGSVFTFRYICLSIKSISYSQWTDNGSGLS